MIGIYKITNKINNKVYIGQSINIEERFAQHKYSLRRNFAHNTHFQNAWNKYGEENFEFEPIHITSEKRELNDLEIYYIDKYKSNNPKYGYNVASGGNNPYFNEDYRKEMSIRARGKNSNITLDEARLIKLATYCLMDRKEISEMFNISVKAITGIVIGKSFGYVATELNDKIVNLKHTLIDERNKEILKLYDELHSIKKICDLTGYTVSVVEKAVYKTNKYKNNKYIEIYDKVMELHKQGYNQSEIARKLNIGTTTVSRYVRGLVNPNKELPYKKVTKDIKNKIIELYLNGESRKDIAKIFNISYDTVSTYIKQYEYANTEVS